MSECSNILKISISSICLVLSKKRHHASGYIFFYKYKEHSDIKNRYNNDYSVLNINKDVQIDTSKTYKMKNRCRKILQVDLNENIVNEFNSIKEASITTNIPYTTIFNHLIKEIKKPKKYKWKYK